MTACIDYPSTNPKEDNGVSSFKIFPIVKFVYTFMN